MWKTLEFDLGKEMKGKGEGREGKERAVIDK